MAIDPIGPIAAPPALQGNDVTSGPALLINIAIQTLIVIAGIYALFNFIMAGYAFLSAGDDPKQVQSAWAKIYQSVIGLLFAAGSLILAAIFGQLIFGNANALLQPVLPGL